MPVPTDTFRNIKKLNLIFATSAVLLLLSTLWMVYADHTKPWRQYQIEATAWTAAMTKEAQEKHITQQYKLDLRKIEKELDDVRYRLGQDEHIHVLQMELNGLRDQINRATLPSEVEKGKVNPSLQRYERALNTFGRGDPKVVQLKEQWLENLATFEPASTELATKKLRRVELVYRLNQLRLEETKLEKRLGELERRKNDFKSKLAELEPTGAAFIGSKLRNSPLLDWANPSLQVKQEVTTDVLTDYNFMMVETVDRCMTCHVNIDKPAFERSAQIAFVERQLAMSRKGHNVNIVDEPVVMLDFWVEAAEAVGQLHDKMGHVNEQMIELANELHREAGSEKQVSSSGDLLAVLERLEEIGDKEPASYKRWYQLRQYYRSDLQQLLADHLGGDEYDKLVELYRRELISRFNAVRTDHKPLDSSPVLLAHPRLDRYVDPESPHPMKTMACTACHEGSGQETLFEYTAHEPRSAWVDARTGALVPDFLLTDQVSEPHNGESSDHGNRHRYTHDDLNLNNPDNDSGAPFAPSNVPDSGVGAHYRLPGEQQPRMAVRQMDYWTEKYDWHRVHYVHWEKPMHALQYVESSCSKCHTQVFDIKDAAPRLFKGRRLFAQFGCINCHAVETLDDDLDIRKVGPSLVHVREKISPQMAATWIWAPKAFRPTTLMPHYFMLENNSSPVDILRTRVEVKALSHYLMHAEPDADFYKATGQPAPHYQPESPPIGPGDPQRGREIFNNVGCLSCHSNLSEFGQMWMVQDLVEQGMEERQADETYERMSYNQRHWYVLEHLQHKLERTGPELSAVGTKLKTGRSQQQARAWLYDWLRQPQHYSSKTIMPSLRLSPDEANDIAAYLLTLERPGTDGSSAYAPGDFSLDDTDQAVLRELVARLEAGKGTLTMKMARQHVNTSGEFTDEHQLLMVLGEKMVQHYGCNGCHRINGFEAATSACASLDGWGLKDPHKLAFEYFDHSFDKVHEKPIRVTKVKHEGLLAGSPQVTATSADDIHDVDVWREHLDLERRPWLTHKLHNPRLYDRGRESLNGRLRRADKFEIDQAVPENGDNVGKPYEKLKMPKFFLADHQVQALVTYVTSIRKPLVSEKMQQVTDDAGSRVVRGRQLATRFNCYGCHNIEGNNVNIQQYFNVRFQDGSYDGNALNWVPPRLIGQGAKTRPDWLHHFLQNVQPIRPWLKVRMPSFALTGDDAAVLVDYFAGHSQQLSRQLAADLEPIDQYITQYLANHRAADMAGSRWYAQPSITRQVASLKKFAIDTDLVTAGDLDPRQNSGDDVAANWAKLLKAVRVLVGTFDTDYPYVQQYRPPFDPVRLERARRLVVDMGCMTGQCHRMGDEQVLIREGLLAAVSPFAVEGDQGQGDGELEDELDGQEEEWEDEEFEEEQSGLSLTPNTPAEGAPNLSLTFERLQSRWVRWWTPNAQTIQPGTRMLPLWEGGKSHFAAYPDDVRNQKEAIFGATKDQQLDLVRYFLYAAGPRGFTYNSQVDPIGSMAQVQVELKPLAPLPEAPVADKPPLPTETVSQEPVESAANIPLPQPEPAPELSVVAEKSSIELHDDLMAAYGGTRIVGVVKLDNPKNRRFKSAKLPGIAADPYCGKRHAQPPRKQGLIVGDDMSVQNVFVYVKSGFDKGQKYPATKLAVLDQAGCIYKPHILGAVVGQPVQIINSDRTNHNVHGYEGRKSLFNSASGPGSTIKRVFKKPQAITLKCDVHSWMTGYIHVVENPFFAVSDVQGRFEIKGLPPGRYTLEAVHEHRRIDPVAFEVQVEADTSHRQDLTVTYR